MARTYTAADAASAMFTPRIDRNGNPCLEIRCGNRTDRVWLPGLAAIMACLPTFQAAALKMLGVDVAPPAPPVAPPAPPVASGLSTPTDPELSALMDRARSLGIFVNPAWKWGVKEVREAIAAAEKTTAVAPPTLILPDGTPIGDASVPRDFAADRKAIRGESPSAPPVAPRPPLTPTAKSGSGQDQIDAAAAKRAKKTAEQKTAAAAAKTFADASRRSDLIRRAEALGMINARAWGQKMDLTKFEAKVKAAEIANAATADTPTVPVSAAAPPTAPPTAADVEPLPAPPSNRAPVPPTSDAPVVSTPRAPIAAPITSEPAPTARPKLIAESTAKLAGGCEVWTGVYSNGSIVVTTFDPDGREMSSSTVRAKLAPTAAAA
jgi:hypothetical protein